MKILILNQNWLAPELREAGHEVVTAGLYEQFDVRWPAPLVHVDTIIKEIPGSFEPDVIVYHDNSSPILVAGLDETAIPTLFYSVDTHHHRELHSYLGHLYDALLVAQKDYVSWLQACGCTADWMPLWASRFMEASSDKQYQAVFVGNLNKKLNPERVAFFEALGKRSPLLCRMGEFWKIFPYSEIVVNQTVKGDLNFRVFEAMMSGALLLTEHSPNGLLDLFRNEVHLVTYEKNNVDQAAELINYYLEHKDRAREIAAAGREEIMRCHLAKHRAVQLMETLPGLQKKKSDVQCFSAMLNFAVLSENSRSSNEVLSRQALVVSLRSAEAGLRRGERLTDELAAHLVAACINYDRLLQTTAGDRLLEQMKEAYPGMALFDLYGLRRLLNRGSIQEARRLAESLGAQDPGVLFQKAEEVISSLLESLSNPTA